jgi:hypothetical protein
MNDLIERLKLEARRLRGLLAYLFIIHIWRGDLLRFPLIVSWAGLYAHWDWDRENWSSAALTARMKESRHG